MSVNFWQNYNIRVESWEADYDAPISLDGEETDSHSFVDLKVEGKWVKRKPRRIPSLPNTIVFIDGCRRIDARFLGREKSQPFYGAFATIAVGAVVVDRTLGCATLKEALVSRAIAIAGDRKPPVTKLANPFGTQAELTYDLCLTAPENTPQTPLALIQKAMLEAEANLAATLAKEPDTLVVRDGPLLHGCFKVPAATLGYVKTMGKSYLSEEHAALLWQLELGDRTPIFAIGDKNNATRHWSWYLRSGQANVNPKTLGYHDLHGLVRLDLYGEVPLEKAKEIADRSTYLIPQYASEPTRDPRAPQNLTPIGALERELRRRMGDRALIERRLRAFLTSTGDMP